ncbi:hypothetical protein JG687_00011231 [Phytophthora cactorum]|uniref:Uncharacterized protein n=1 Tax=Phytophthora cactorum TaxID=29920 RepID=A0A8T1U6E9_9STRA|nr:hypothetical protein JG687_00011231 [Phytophthora cactorum]
MSAAGPAEGHETEVRFTTAGDERASRLVGVRRLSSTSLRFTDMGMVCCRV